MPRITQIPKTQFLQKIFVIFISNTPTMKHLLFLLFTTACFAQNAKVRIYRVFEESTQPPCSIQFYMKAKEYGMIFTAESDDQSLVERLHKVKLNSLKWPKEKYSCDDNWTDHGLVICNMFVIEGTHSIDTIFTTANNHSIVLPNKKIQFIDKKQELNKALTDDIKGFFRRNFYMEMFRADLRILDSIYPDKIIYKGTPFSKVNIDSIVSFKSSFGIPVEWDKNDNKKYRFDEEIMTDYNNLTVELPTDDILYFTADKICIGDHEDLLLKKYPNSTKYQRPYSTRYEEIKNNYFYELKIRDMKYTLVFSIKDKKINGIGILMLSKTQE
jgi:hypothetical protein